jgi:hypothetical protein
LLPDVLASKVKPKDAAELLGLAKLCREYKKLYVAAVLFYAQAFDADPKLAVAPHRYNAACAAVLAAAAKGNDPDKLDAQAQAKLRKQALDWLRAELVALGKQLQDKPKSTATLQKTLQHWQRDSDLASVRDTKELVKLSESEQKEWQQLWSDVATLHAKTANPAPGSP